MVVIPHAVFGKSILYLEGEVAHYGPKLGQLFTPSVFGTVRYRLALTLAAVGKADLEFGLDEIF